MKTTATLSIRAFLPLFCSLLHTMYASIYLSILLKWGESRDGPVDVEIPHRSSHYWSANLHGQHCCPCGNSLPSDLSLTNLQRRFVKGQRKSSSATWQRRDPPDFACGVFIRRSSTTNERPSIFICPIRKNECEIRW